MQQAITVSDEARELALYIENDSQTYFSYTVPTMKNLAKHYRKGNGDRTLAERSFLRIATAGAKHYATEFGGFNTRWDRMFPMSARRECASMLFEAYIDEIKELAAA